MKTILPDHTTPETAYVVDDYPYGFTLRCKIRYGEILTDDQKKMVDLVEKIDRRENPNSWADWDAKALAS
jgi:hypothetical protein